MTGKIRHGNNVALLLVCTSPPPPPPPPNQITAQNTWNESAKQEKQFDIHFMGVEETTSGSVPLAKKKELFFHILR